jgi:hypothetical protein
VQRDIATIVDAAVGSSKEADLTYSGGSAIGHSSTGKIVKNFDLKFAAYFFAD